jgi:hypothetical protein
MLEWKMQLAIVLPVLIVAIVLTMAWVGWRFFLRRPELGLWLVDKPAASVMEQAIPQGLSLAEPDSAVAPSPAKPGLQHRYNWLTWPLLSLLLVGVGMFAVFVMGGRYYQQPDYVAQDYQQSDRIKQTLLEEKLIPPPPLPPAAFNDVQNQMPTLDIAHANRDWSRMNPAFVQTVLRVMVAMRARGFGMVLLEGYRSPERQNALAAQGNHVTQAKGGQSKHQYGLAVDLAPIRAGKVVISERDPWAMQAYQALGEEAQRAGLTWGGNWSFKDYGHIEQTGSLKVLLGKR